MDNITNYIQERKKSDSFYTQRESIFFCFNFLYLY